MSDIRLPTSEQLDVIVTLVVLVILSVIRTLKSASKTTLNVPQVFTHSDIHERLEILEQSVEKVTQSVELLLEKMEKSAKIRSKYADFSSLPVLFTVQISHKSPYIAFNITFSSSKKAESD